jgi:4'-phosphopantetheinyl transferase
MPILSFDDWSPPPAELAISREEVHVWRVALNQPGSPVRELFNLLNLDERERAERFHFRKDRDHFIVARGMLRTILGRYLKLPPQQVRFRYNAYGKPALQSEPILSVLKFNISHSHGLALYTVACDREVGVDVELIREDFANDESITRYFSEGEAETIRALAPELRTQAFFTCWTRKEAFIKAIGEGLSYPLDQFTVSVVPGKRACLLSARGGAQEAGRWSLHDLNCGAGYSAALAVEGYDWRLRCYDYI